MAGHHVVAGAQSRDPAAANIVIRLRPDEAVRHAHHAADPARAAAERHGPRLGCRAVVPALAGHHVVAGAQSRDPVVANLVARRGPEQGADQGASAAVKQIDSARVCPTCIVKGRRDHDIAAAQFDNGRAKVIAVRRMRINELDRRRRQQEARFKRLHHQCAAARLLSSHPALAHVPRTTSDGFTKVKQLSECHGAPLV